ncbi:hypothetical protein [Methylocystis parvus]|uniref:Uncharacterized protein n=1 Tax=Methylocystis parvus TaxID=134 RepID=A0A6B8M0V3_9HYPH|nr:hypothetical protein [Methylocystis parvus]QGM97414.1 hypothetical protein F7D14_07965 [Methylocystis parvus]WBJ98672.1 hypothetical protein MMG94_11640 [Methylocystis parvus OBBP]
MELEQFYAFEVDAPLSDQRRALIESHIDANAEAFGRNVTRSWHRREGEDFLRILIDPVVIEIVFAGDKIELFGAAPAWARLLFTPTHKDDLRQRIEQVLIAADFTTPEKLAAQKQPKRSLFARAHNKNAAN